MRTKTNIKIELYDTGLAKCTEHAGNRRGTRNRKVIGLQN